MALMDAVEAYGQSPLHGPQGAEGFVIGGVDLRFGQRAPRRRIRIGCNLLRNVFVQSRVGQQPRLGQMRAVSRKRIHQLGLGQGLKAIQLRLAPPAAELAQRRQPRRAICA